MTGSVIDTTRTADRVTRRGALPFARTDGRQLVRTCLPWLLLSPGALLQAAESLPAPSVDPAIPAYRAASVHAAPDAPYLDDTGAIRLGGAEHVRYIVERFDTLFAQTHPGVRFNAEARGTTTALPLLTYGVILFGPLGRGINAGETQAYREANGGAPLEIRVAHASNDTCEHLATSLAVYVNRANPIEALSEAQVARMLSIGNPGGDYSRWGQAGLGGVWAPRAIHPYGTPEYSGFGDYLQTHHLGGRRLAPDSEQYGDTGSILKRLEQDPAGIAIAAIGRDTANIKAIAIVAPQGAGAMNDSSAGSSASAGAGSTSGTPAEIMSNRFPYGRFLYFYVRKLPGQPLDPVAVEYLRLVLSREGQQIIASQRNGYMPLSAQEVRAELAKLK